MEKLINILIDNWFLFAFIFSFYWGIRGVFLFGKNKFWWWSYEFLFNFIGSFAGWCCFLALLTRVQSHFPSYNGFTAGDIVLFFVSLLGLTGHLPQATYGIVQGFSEVVTNGIKKITK